MLEPLGGQTVTLGKSSSDRGWVEIDVRMGEACQPVYELFMRVTATVKPATTTRLQRHLETLEGEEAMWDKP